MSRSQISAIAIMTGHGTKWWQELYGLKYDQDTVERLPERLRKHPQLRKKHLDRHLQEHQQH